jgi:hypothetical protein
MKPVSGYLMMYIFRKLRGGFGFAPNEPVSSF